MLHLYRGDKNFGLDRRDFIKIGLGAGLSLIYSDSLTAETKHEKAVRDKSYRQMFLDEIVDKNLVEKVIYDHDILKVNKRLENCCNEPGKGLAGEQYTHRYLTALIPEYAKWPVEKKRTEMHSMLENKTPEFERYIGAANEQMMKFFNSAVAYIYPPGNFGENERPEMYVFRSAFGIEIELQGLYRYNKKVSEHLFKQFLEHEYVHAGDYKNGVELGNGVLLTHSNYLELHPDTLTLLFEVRGFSHSVDSSRVKGKVLFTDPEPYPNDYMTHIQAYLNFLRIISNKIEKVKQVSELDKVVFNDMFKMAHRKTPEIFKTKTGMESFKKIFFKGNTWTNQ